LLKRGENRTFHISSGQGATLNQIYQEIAQDLESRLEPIYLPRTSQQETEIILDNSQAQQSLGWRPTIALHEGIQMTLARMREKQQQALPQTVHMPAVRTGELTTAVETTLTWA
jgi:nucleoside-diphosphate-sugar epimerase